MEKLREVTPRPARRFYPMAIPPFPHEPTRDRFRIRRTREFGQGVVCLVPFRRGEVIFACAGYLVTEVTQFSLQIQPGLHLHDPYFYGKILHSCAPNALVDVQKRQFVANRDIQPMEYITMDYAQTEDRLFRTFMCNCGAANCRGFIAGRHQVQTPVSAPLRSVAQSARPDPQ